MNAFPKMLAHRRAPQQGAAMLVALMILIVVTIIGVAAMRSSVFNSKIATGARASTMAFQASESALAALFTEAADQNDANPDNALNVAIGQLSLGVFESVERCITVSDMSKPGACTASDRYDSAGLMQASYRLAVNPNPRVAPPSRDMNDGGQISRAGEGTTIFGDYQFVGVGHGRLDMLDVDQFNIQEFARRGIIPGDDL